MCGDVGRRIRGDCRAISRGRLPIGRHADHGDTVAESAGSAEWLSEGVHVTALGSDSPGKQELMAECLDSADLVVVDRFAQCAAFGELKHAMDAGLLKRNDVHAELGEIVAGRKPGGRTIARSRSPT